MKHWTYLLLLAGCVVVTLPLELVLGVRVWRRPLRLLLTLLPVLSGFVAWDVAAIGAGQWRYDRAQTVGIRLPGRLPLEEILFFVVIPVCSVMTLEAVRIVRRWRIGDEGP